MPAASSSRNSLTTIPPQMSDDTEQHILIAAFIGVAVVIVIICLCALYWYNRRGPAGTNRRQYQPSHNHRSNRNDDGNSPHCRGIPPPPYVYENRSLQYNDSNDGGHLSHDVSIKLKMPWDEGYERRDSEKFHTLRDEIVEGIEELYKQYQDFRGAILLRFRSGSVIADIHLRFSQFAVEPLAVLQKTLSKGWWCGSSQVDSRYFIVDAHLTSSNRLSPADKTRSRSENTGSRCLSDKTESGYGSQEVFDHSSSLGDKMERLQHSGLMHSHSISPHHTSKKGGSGRDIPESRPSRRKKSRSHSSSSSYRNSRASKVELSATTSTDGVEGDGYDNSTVIARFNFSPQDERELALKQGEMVRIVSMHQDGWVKVVNEAGKEGWVPHNFIAHVDPLEYEETKKAVESLIFLDQVIESADLGSTGNADTDEGSDDNKTCGQDTNDSPPEHNLKKHRTKKSQYENVSFPSHVRNSEQLHGSCCKSSREKPSYENLPKPLYAKLTSDIPCEVSSEEKTPKCYRSNASKPSSNASKPRYENIGLSGVFITIFPFEPSDNKELKLEVGDVIEVKKVSETGWWKGYCVRTDNVGWFPSTYVRPSGKLTDTGVTESVSEIGEGSKVQDRTSAQSKSDSDDSPKQVEDDALRQTSEHAPTLRLSNENMVNDNNTKNNNNNNNNFSISCNNNDNNDNNNNISNTEDITLTCTVKKKEDSSLLNVPRSPSKPPYIRSFSDTPCTVLSKFQMLLPLTNRDGGSTIPPPSDGGNLSPSEPPSKPVPPKPRNKHIRQTYEKLFGKENDIPSPNELVTRSMESLHISPKSCERRGLLGTRASGCEEMFLMKPLNRERPLSCENNARFLQLSNSYASQMKSWSLPSLPGSDQIKLSPDDERPYLEPIPRKRKVSADADELLDLTRSQCRETVGIAATDELEATGAISTYTETTTNLSATTTQYNEETSYHSAEREIISEVPGGTSCDNNLGDDFVINRTSPPPPPGRNSLKYGLTVKISSMAENRAPHSVREDEGNVKECSDDCDCLGKEDPVPSSGNKFPSSECERDSSDANFSCSDKCSLEDDRCDEKRPCGMEEGDNDSVKTERASLGPHHDADPSSSSASPLCSPPLRLSKLVNKNETTMASKSPQRRREYLSPKTDLKHLTGRGRLLNSCGETESESSSRTSSTFSLSSSLNSSLTASSLASSLPSSTTSRWTTSAGKLEQLHLRRAVTDVKGCGEGELSFNAGALLYELRPRNKQGLCYGLLEDSTQGWYPENAVETFHDIV